MSKTIKPSKAEQLANENIVCEKDEKARQLTMRVTVNLST